MLTTLNGINCLYSSDNKRIKVKDSYVNLKKKRVDQFICQVSGYLFSRNVLVSPLLINDFDSDDSDQRYQLFLCKERLQSFRDQRSVKTQAQEYRESSKDEIKNIIYNSDYAWDPFNVTTLSRSASKRESNQIFSLKELDGYLIESIDNTFGTFSDFIVDQRTWELKYIVVDLGEISSRELKVIPIHLIKKINWPTLSVLVDLKGVVSGDLPNVPRDYYSAGVILEKDVGQISTPYVPLKSASY